ncbi:helix-turn-helix domain-containing protein [Stenotrophomonas maltophilia]|uniref:helix-turn-helix domain-containing protein n=1 Tax=Stenotrophomonas maltophilia TaxID=40324 RepID=UPI0040578291
MRGEPVVGIQPSVMRWARESAGMSVDDVATRLKRQLAEVESWESGDGAPTYPQLERLAYELYKRPLAVFFLPEPPQEVSPRQQFRTLPAEELASLSRDTYLHLRKARAYQVGLEDLYSETNPAPRKIWHHVSLQRNQDVAAQAMNIRRELGIDSPTQAQWGGRRSSLEGLAIGDREDGCIRFQGQL